MIDRVRDGVTNQGLASGVIGCGNLDLRVEATFTYRGVIKPVHVVGGCDQYHSFASHIYQAGEHCRGVARIFSGSICG